MTIRIALFYPYHEMVMQYIYYSVSQNNRTKYPNEITLKIVIDILFFEINKLCALTTMYFHSSMATIIINNENLRFYLTKLLNSM